MTSQERLLNTRLGTGNEIQTDTLHPLRGFEIKCLVCNSTDVTLDIQVLQRVSSVHIICRGCGNTEVVYD